MKTALTNNTTKPTDFRRWASSKIKLREIGLRQGSILTLSIRRPVTAVVIDSARIYRNDRRTQPRGNRPSGRSIQRDDSVPEIDIATGDTGPTVEFGSIPFALSAAPIAQPVVPFSQHVAPRGFARTCYWRLRRLTESTQPT